MTSLSQRGTKIAMLMLLLTPALTRASFHEMQIQKVIAGVNGNTAAQAIQLRMRAVNQNSVSLARLVVRDADGNNPVVVVDFPSNVGNAAAGSTILVTTAAFNAATAPETESDFGIAQPIPASYLAAGSLTFEAQNTGAVYWRISWGGDDYTGSTMGVSTNDADSDFGTPFPGPLPSVGPRALEFQGPAEDPSTTNALDYAISEGAAVFTNNAAAEFAVVGLEGDLDQDGDLDLDDLTQLVICAEGPDVQTAPASCAPSSFGACDLTGDSDVDLEDVSVFWALLGR